MTRIKRAAALPALAAFIVSLSLMATEVEAKRLGGGGMKRSTPTQPAPAQPAKPAQPQQAPAQQAAPATGAAAAAAAPAKRSWMGPIAGLAAGLGLAALASHFGFGEALANIMTMVLLGLVLMLVLGFVMRRFAARKLAAAAPGGMQFAGMPQQQLPVAHQAPAAAPALAPQAARSDDDDGFDTEGFTKLAKQVFIRMQAANDAGDQGDLRRFTTPQMYASIQQQLLERGSARQRTDVLQLDAQVLERVEEQGEQIVSVRFWGLVREQSEAAGDRFDEVWHLQRPLDGSREWAIAGIQPMA